MKLYWKFFAIHLKSELAYPGAFILSCLGRLTYTFSSLLSVFLLLNRFGTIAGYSLEEVLLGFGVVMTAFYLAECFARGFDAFGRIVRLGQMDLLLIRPRNLIFQVICQDTRLASLPNIFAGMLIIGYGIKAGSIVWTLPKAAVLVSMVICGALLFFGMFMVYASVCFFSMAGLEVLNIFTDGIRTYSRYPFDVYGKGILWFTTVCMPMAMVQTWPLRYLTGKGSAWYGLFPILSLWFLIPCLLFWRFGVRHYTSSGT